MIIEGRDGSVDFVEFGDIKTLNVGEGGKRRKGGFSRGQGCDEVKEVF